MSVVHSQAQDQVSITTRLQLLEGLVFPASTPPSLCQPDPALSPGRHPSPHCSLAPDAADPDLDSTSHSDLSSNGSPCPPHADPDPSLSPRSNPDSIERAPTRDQCPGPAPAHGPSPGTVPPPAPGPAPNRDAISLLTGCCQKLAASVQELKRTAARLRADFCAAEQARLEDRREVESVRAGLRRLSTGHDAQERATAALQEQARAAEAKAADADRRLSGACAQLTAQHREAQALLQPTLKRVTAVERTAGLAERSCGALSAALEALGQRHDALEGAVERAARQCGDHTAGLSRLRDELQAYRVEQDLRLELVKREAGTAPARPVRPPAPVRCAATRCLVDPRSACDAGSHAACVAGDLQGLACAMQKAEQSLSDLRAWQQEVVQEQRQHAGAVHNRQLQMQGDVQHCKGELAQLQTEVRYQRHALEQQQHDLHLVQQGARSGALPQCHGGDVPQRQQQPEEQEEEQLDNHNDDDDGEKGHEGRSAGSCEDKDLRGSANARGATPPQPGPGEPPPMDVAAAPGMAPGSDAGGRRLQQLEAAQRALLLRLDSACDTQAVLQQRVAEVEARCGAMAVQLQLLQAQQEPDHGPPPPSEPLSHDHCLTPDPVPDRAPSPAATRPPAHSPPPPPQAFRSLFADAALHLLQCTVPADLDAGPEASPGPPPPAVHMHMPPPAQDPSPPESPGVPSAAFYTPEASDRSPPAADSLRTRLLQRLQSPSKGEVSGSDQEGARMSPFSTDDDEGEGSDFSD